MSKLKEKKLFLLDMDGTIYLDDDLFDGTLDFLDYVKEIGGRYILSPAIFNLLEKQQRGVGNEIQLTDSIKKLMETEDVYSCKLSGKRYDIGSRIGFIEATIDFALKRDDFKDQVINLFKNKKIG